MLGISIAIISRILTLNAIKHGSLHELRQLLDQTEQRPFFALAQVQASFGD